MRHQRYLFICSLLALCACSDSAPGGSVDADADVDAGTDDAPSLSIQILPEAPVTTDALRVVGEWSDGRPAEGLSLRWSRDGEEFGDAETIPAVETGRDQVWSVVATTSAPEDTASHEVTIANSAPRAISVTMISDDPSVEGEVFCLAHGVDPDEDPISWSYRWFINEAEVDDVTGPLLDGSLYQKGDTLGCEATPSDDSLSGEPMSSDNTVVAGDAPAFVSQVQVSPDTLYTCQVPSCEVSVVDPDGDSPDLELEYAWLVDDQIVPGASDALLTTGPFDWQSTIRCRVRSRVSSTDPWQLHESDDITVSNLPPAVFDAEITAVAYPGDVVHCTPLGFMDPDCGADEAFRFVWTVNGVERTEDTGATLDTRLLEGADVVACTVYPHDGIEEGAGVTSSEITLQPTGFEIIGELPDSAAGWSVAILDDLNGDGQAELALGAPTADSGGGRTHAGLVYVVYGEASDEDIDLADVAAGNGGFVFAGESGGLAYADYLCAGYAGSCGGFHGLNATSSSLAVSTGPQGDLFGWKVDNAGDLDGDGVGDLVVGAPYAFEYPHVYRGKAYAISGATLAMTNIPSVLSEASSDGFFALGEYGSRVSQATDPNNQGRIYNGDLFGYATTGVGDVNGDGLNDFAVGAVNFGNDDEGKVYVIYGRDDGKAVDMAALDATPPVGGFTITGGSSGFFPHHFGIEVQGVGDVDGDGYDDLMVQTGIMTSFATHVVFGSPGPEVSYAYYDADVGLPPGAPTRTMKVLNGDLSIQNNEVVRGRAIPQHQIGGGGDVNGDGFSDFVIASEATDVPSEILVVFGRSSRADIDLDGVALGNGGFMITGDVSTFIPAGALRIGGDLNGDGLDDIVIASAFDSVYVVYGKSDGAVVSLEDVALGIGGFQFTIPDAAGRAFAQSVAVGDINDDGLADFLVSAPNTDTQAGEDVGGAVVRFGRDYGNNITFRGGDSDDTFTGTSADEVFVSGGGSDTLYGNGGADVMYGGGGDDFFHVADLSFRSLRGGRGTDTVVLEENGLTFDLNALRGRVRDIEQVSLEGNGSQTLNVETLDLLRLSSSSNTLRVMGDAGDTVGSFASRWFYEGTETFEGRDYYRLVNGRAVLAVETEVNTLIAPDLVTEHLLVPEDTPVAGVAGPLDSTDPDGQVVAFTLVDEHGQPGVFAVDGLSGDITVIDAAPLDFEGGPGLFVLTIEVQDDDGLTQQKQVTLEITDVDEAPVFSLSNPTLGVSEAAPNGTPVGAVFADDPDAGDSVTYTLQGAEAAPFAIDATTGAITVADASLLDFETAATHAFQVEARDTTGLTTFAAVTVQVTDATVLSTSSTLYFLTNNASIWDGGAPEDLLLSAGSSEVDMNNPPSSLRLPVDFGDWEVTADISGTMEIDNALDFKGGAVDIYVPVDVSLSFPDELQEGQSFDLTSTWQVLPEAKFVAESPSLETYFILQSLNDVGFFFELCIGGCLPAIDNSWSYTGPYELIRYVREAKKLHGTPSPNNANYLSTPRITVPAVDTTIDWDSYWDNIMSALNLPSNEGTYTVNDTSGAPWVHVDYTAFATELFTRQTYTQSNSLRVNGVNGQLVFTEVSITEPFVVGTTTSIPVPVGADANGDGRIEVEMEFSLDQTFSTDAAVVGESGKRLEAVKVVVRSAANPGDFDYFEPYQKGPLVDTSFTANTNYVVDMDFPLQDVNAPILQGSLDKGP